MNTLHESTLTLMNHSRFMLGNSKVRSFDFEVNFPEGDNNFNISIIDDEPMVKGMAAAMFSRSTQGIRGIAQLIEDKNKSGEDFLAEVYVGYGHASVGDLVDMKMYVSGIPLPVIIWLERFMKFNGQETSSRYVDFSRQPEWKAATPLYDWRYMYNSVFQEMKGLLTAENKPETENDNRAIKARAFDVARGMLPMSVTSNVAIYTDLNSFMRHISYLEQMTVTQPEIWNVDEALQASFRHVLNAIKQVLVEVYGKACKFEFPEMRSSDGSYDYIDRSAVFTAPLDLGSSRDLNRHRLGVITNFPFNVECLNQGRLNLFYVNSSPSFQTLSKFGRYKSLLQAPMATEFDLSYATSREHLEYYIYPLRSKPESHASLRAWVEAVKMNYSTLNGGAMVLSPAYNKMLMRLAPQISMKRGRQTITVGGKELA